jgi:hypothetical protein
MTLTIELTPEQLASLSDVHDITVAYKKASVKKQPIIEGTEDAAAQFKALKVQSTKEQETRASCSRDAGRRKPSDSQPRN